MNVQDKKHLIGTLTGAAVLLSMQPALTETHADTVQAIDECIELLLLLPTDKDPGIPVEDRATAGFDIASLLNVMGQDGETAAGHVAEEASYPKGVKGYAPDDRIEDRDYPKRLNPEMPPALKNVLHKLSEAVIAGALDEADNDAIGSMVVSRGVRQAVVKQTGGEAPNPTDELVAKARKVLAQKLGIPVEAINVIKI